MTGGGPAHGPELTMAAVAGEAPQPSGVAGSIASTDTGMPGNEDNTPSAWAGFRRKNPLLALILQRLALSVMLLFAVSVMIFGGVMPAWEPLIGTDRARLAVAWLLSQRAPAQAGSAQ